MADEQMLHDRLEQLEQRVAQLARSGGRHRRLVLVAIAFSIGLAPTCLLGLWHAELTRRQSQQQSFWLLCHDHSTAAERVRAFLELVASGNEEWRSARLQGLDLAGALLSAAPLVAADLQNSILTRARLDHAVLTRARLQNVELTGANLEEADLTEADLFKASLRQANLRKARLTGASLQQADATEADLMLADLAGARLAMCELSHANLTAANLSDARLQTASLRGANLLVANLAGADLSQADLTDTNWWRARGLEVAMMEELKQKFAPSATADPKLREDYQRWLDKKQPN